MQNSQEIDLFVPGRICLFGEHSDWAGGHRRVNSEIIPGRCIISGTNQGLYAKVRPSKERLVFRTRLADGKLKELDEPIDAARLLEIAREGGFWSYIAGVAYQILTHYSVGGIEVENYRTDLPLKKGLSSSAATCVLVARAFNRVYDLRMTTRGEMDLAYRGEITTPSRCGRMDQGCAYGGRPIVMNFDGDSIDVDEVKVGDDLFLVIVDLQSRKDTVKILASLNRAYPFAESEAHRAAQTYLGATNSQIVARAIAAMEDGNAQEFGALMREAQAEFDRALGPLCPEELAAPVLHRLLADRDLEPLVWGGKGVGSQGDGSAQFVARGRTEQEALAAMLVEKGFGALPLTIRRSRRIKKAVITAAGFGTRLFPMTKAVRKEFLPIVDKGLLKPLILKHVEDAVEAGMDEVFLVVQGDEVDQFKKLFSEPLRPELYAKLGPEARKAADDLTALGAKVKYIVQEEQGGLGHAVLKAAEALGGEGFALVLGDHVFTSEEAGRSCLRQLLDAAENEEGDLIGVMTTAEEDVGRFGCVGGQWQDKEEGLLSIGRFIEKPNVETAREHLRIEGLAEDQYLSVAGIYIISRSIADELKQMDAAREQGEGELELTAALERSRKKALFLGLMIAGTKSDIGVVSSWEM